MDPLLYIERGLEYQHRKNWGRLLFIWSILFLSLTMTSLILKLPAIYPIAFEILFLLLLALYIANALMKALFLHIYKERIKKGRGKTYEVLVAEEKAREYRDDVIGFINSKYGDETMKRLGISRQSLEDYIERRKFLNKIKKETENDFIDLPTYALMLHDNDPHFATFLRNQRVLRNDLLHAARLVQNTSSLSKEHDRAWSKETLHDLSSFELDALEIERAHGVYFTSPVLMKLAVLDDDEKLDILKKIIPETKKQRRSQILISDL